MSYKQINYHDYININHVKFTEFEKRKISNIFDDAKDYRNSDIIISFRIKTSIKNNFYECDLKKNDDDYFFISILQYINNKYQWNNHNFYECDQLSELLSFLNNIYFVLKDRTIITNELILKKIDNKDFIKKILMDSKLDNLLIIQSLYKKGYNIHFKFSNIVNINVFLFLVKHNIEFINFDNILYKSYIPIPNINKVLIKINRQYPEYFTKKLIDFLKVDFYEIYDKLDKSKINSSLISYMPSKEIINNILDYKLRINEDYRKYIKNIFNSPEPKNIKLKKEYISFFEISPYYNKYKKFISTKKDIIVKDDKLYYSFNKLSILPSNYKDYNDISFIKYLHGSKSNQIFNREEYKKDINKYINHIYFEDLENISIINSINYIDDFINCYDIVNQLSIDINQVEHDSDDYRIMVDEIIELLENKYNYNTCIFFTDGNEDLIIELSKDSYEKWINSKKEYFDFLIRKSEKNSYERVKKISHDNEINLLETLIYIDTSYNEKCLILSFIDIESSDFEIILRNLIKLL